MPNEDVKQLATTVPDAWIERVDEEIRRETTRLGTMLSRSDIVRMALARYLGLTDGAGEPRPERAE